MDNKRYDETEIIKVSNVQQQFIINNEPLVALKEVNFTIQANTFTIIFGASGSGKSTLLNVLAGLQAPSAGKVLINHEDI